MFHVRDNSEAGVCLEIPYPERSPFHHLRKVRAQSVPLRIDYGKKIWNSVTAGLGPLERISSLPDSEHLVRFLTYHTPWLSNRL